MRLLVIHNTLWAHYKSLLFQRLAAQMQLSDAFLVVQIALTERHRAGLGVPDAAMVGYPFALLHDGSLEEVSLSQRIRGLLTQAWAFKPDVVLLTGYYDPAQLLLGALLKARGCRVVLQNESTALDTPRTGWREQLKRRFIQLCDGFFCFGTRAADYMIQLGAAPDQILVRNNAVVDNDRLRAIYEQALPERAAAQQRLGLSPRNLIYVGRLTSVKNLSALLTAFSAVRQRHPASDWGLILLGEGDQKSQLQQQTAALQLTDNVHFLPGCDWQQVPRFLALADALVLPSWSEPWGLVVNEAMACGLPVLVSDRCGCADDLVINGQNGYRFDPGQPDQLTNRLDQFVTASPDELDRMGAASLQRITAFDPTTVGQAMFAALRHLASSNP